MSGFSHMSDDQDGWHVYVDNRVYGPFDGGALIEFFKEGRLTANSLMCPAATGPFRPAAEWSHYDRWTRPHHSSRQSDLTQPDTRTLIDPTVYLVMAEIRSPHGMAFLQTLQSIGPVERVSNTIWLVRSRLDAATVKAALSATLSQQDRLLITQVDQDRLGTVNLGQSVDERIAALFKH